MGELSGRIAFMGLHQPDWCCGAHCSRNELTTGNGDSSVDGSQDEAAGRVPCEPMPEVDCVGGAQDRQHRVAPHRDRRLLLYRYVRALTYS